MGYIEIMMEATSKSEVLKIVDGNLTSGTPSLYNKALGFFGAGEYSQVAVAKFLSDHSKDILEEVSSMYKQGGKIAPVQEQIDSVFKAAGIVNDSIDVFSNIYSNWMGSLPDYIKDKAVHDLLLPGTHDSAANHYDYSKPIQEKDGNAGFIALNKVFSIPVIGSFIAKHTVGAWGVAQSMSIKEQLEHGIRAFDIRIAHDYKTGELVVSHTFTSGTFEETLKQFKEFMDEHPTEVVLIEIMQEPKHRSPDLTNNNKSDAYKNMINLINQYLGDKLLPPKDRDIKLKDAVDSGKTAMVSFTGNLKNTGNIHHDAAKNFWGNQQSIESAMKLADTKFSDPVKPIGKSPFQLYAYTTTPDAKMIVNNIAHGGPILQPWGLKEMAEELNGHFPEFLENHPDAGNKVTGFIFDDPSNSLIETIIQHNLHDYNG